MAKMTWHDAGTREIQAGVSEVALFVVGANGAYNTGVPWNGVTAINENPSGADITDLYADDINYASLRAAEKFGFGIEAFTYPEAWSECDGSKQVADGVYISQQPRKAFGLVYKSKIGDEQHPGLDKGYKLHIIYNSTASPSSRSYTTINENPDALTFSWDANSTPVEVTNQKPTCEIVIDSTKATPAKLTTLLGMIYGGDNSDPTLPTPDTVISTMSGT